MINDLNQAKDYAREHFPAHPLEDWGRLIQIYYYNHPKFRRFVLVESITAEHITGICLSRHYEGTGDYERRFRLDGIIGSITLPSGEMSSREYYEHFVKTYYPTRRLGFDSTRGDNGRPQIYFTGFAAKEREELETIAKANGLWITSGMTENMSYLVCGPRAGAKKIEKGRQLGTIITDKDGFMALIENGEIIRI